MWKEALNFDSKNSFYLLSRSTAAAAAAEELSKSEERLRESHSECKKLREEKARMEVVVRMLEAEVKEVSGIQYHFHPKSKSIQNLQN